MVIQHVNICNFLEKEGLLNVMRKQPPPWSDIYTILADAESLLGSLLHLWRLRTPSTSNRTYSDISKFLRTIIYFLNWNKIKESIRAGCIRTEL